MGRCLDLGSVSEYVSGMGLVCRGAVCICTLVLSFLTLVILSRLSVGHLNFCLLGCKVRPSRFQCQCAMFFPTIVLYVVLVVGM